MSSSPTGRPASSPGSRPLVSVVIATYNRPELLGCALGSVAGQQLHGPVEAIVVNDGGVPVAPIVQAWKEVLPVKLVELDHVAGVSATRNAGIDCAAGEYIAFLDDDDLFLPGHLAAGCRPLDRNEADFVYLGAVVSDRRLTDLPPDLAGFRLKAYPYDDRLLQVANYLHIGSVITRNFQDTAVRFDLSLDVCEDWDLWLALTRDLGYRVAFVDEITSVYHQVPDVPGLVAEAQLTSPSRFAVTRDYIQAKWPASDPLVHAYREWMNAFEQFRSDLIARDRRMPNLLFDEVLGYLHERISRGKMADHGDIGRFFASD